MKNDLVEQIAAELIAHGEFGSTEGTNRNNARDAAIAVLAIARPAILEEAAKVAADNYRDHGKTFGTQRAKNYEHAGRAVASAIRALATTGQEGGR